MIQITPQMHVLVAVEPVDLRKGIDGLAAVCREKLQADPFSGWLFVFRNRRLSALRILVYDGQGFWLATKRLSRSRFRWWPASAAAVTTLEAHQLQRLIMAGDPRAHDAHIGARILEKGIQLGGDLHEWLGFWRLRPAERASDGFKAITRHDAFLIDGLPCGSLLGGLRLSQNSEALLVLVALEENPVGRRHQDARAEALVSASSFDASE